MQRPLERLATILEEHYGGRRMRVALLLALAMHALPLLAASGQPGALLGLENLGAELLIEIESAASLSAGLQGAGEAAREQGSLPIPALSPREPEPSAETQEPETKVVPASAGSDGAELAPAENAGHASSLGVNGTGDGIFAGTGAGTLHTQICFIPETTRWLREIGDCPTIHEEHIDRINIPRRHFTAGFPGFPERTEFFAVDIQGSFSVTQPGIYGFRLRSDDGSQLFIDGQLIVDNDGLHEPMSRRGEVELNAGQHRIRVWYFQGVRFEVALQLFVKPPGGAERIFTSEL